VLKRKRPQKDGRPLAVRSRKQPRNKIHEPQLDSSSGIKVRSKLEQKCVDILRSHKINFQYEPLILLSGKQLRPDFYLPDYNLFIEICGLRKMPYYDERYNSKEKLYEIYSLDVIIIEANSTKDVENKLLKSFQVRKIISND
jgi:hypothetical protein